MTHIEFSILPLEGDDVGLKLRTPLPSTVQNFDKTVNLFWDTLMLNYSLNPLDKNIVLVSVLDSTGPSCSHSSGCSSKNVKEIFDFVVGQIRTWTIDKGYIHENAP